MGGGGGGQSGRRPLKIPHAIVWLFWMLLATWGAVGLRHLRVSNSMDAWMPDLATPAAYRSYLVIGFPSSRVDAATVVTGCDSYRKSAFCVDPASVAAQGWLTGLTPEDFVVSKDGSYGGVFCFARDACADRRANSWSTSGRGR